MKFDASLLVHNLEQIPALARFVDNGGFNGIWTFETAHEAFLPLVLAAEHSSCLSLAPASPSRFRAVRRSWKSIEVSSSIFVIPTGDPAAAAKYESEIREQISFYASTPAYRPVFELKGWGDVADELKAMAARGQWSEMPALITDEMLDRFALRGT